MNVSTRAIYLLSNIWPTGDTYTQKEAVAHIRIDTGTAVEHEMCSRKQHSWLPQTAELFTPSEIYVSAYSSNNNVGFTVSCSICASLFWNIFIKSSEHPKLCRQIAEHTFICISVYFNTATCICAEYVLYIYSMDSLVSLGGIGRIPACFLHSEGFFYCRHRRPQVICNEKRCYFVAPQTRWDVPHHMNVITLSILPSAPSCNDV